MHRLADARGANRERKTGPYCIATKLIQTGRPTSNTSPVGSELAGLLVNAEHHDVVGILIGGEQIGAGRVNAEVSGSLAVGESKDPRFAPISIPFLNRKSGSKYLGNLFGKSKICCNPVDERFLLAVEHDGTPWSRFSCDKAQCATDSLFRDVIGHSLPYEKSHSIRSISCFDEHIPKLLAREVNRDIADMRGEASENLLHAQFLVLLSRSVVDLENSDIFQKQQQKSVDIALEQAYNRLRIRIQYTEELAVIAYGSARFSVRKSVSQEVRYEQTD